MSHIATLADGSYSWFHDDNSTDMRHDSEKSWRLKIQTKDGVQSTQRIGHCWFKPEATNQQNQTVSHYRFVHESMITPNVRVIQLLQTWCEAVPEHAEPMLTTRGKLRRFWKISESGVAECCFKIKAVMTFQRADSVTESLTLIQIHCWLTY